MCKDKATAQRRLPRPSAEISAEWAEWTGGRPMSARAPGLRGSCSLPRRVNQPISGRPVQMPAGRRHMPVIGPAAAADDP